MSKEQCGEFDSDVRVLRVNEELIPISMEFGSKGVYFFQLSGHHPVYKQVI